jgi:hypothetical protein
MFRATIPRKIANQNLNRHPEPRPRASVFFSWREEVRDLVFASWSKEAQRLSGVIQQSPVLYSTTNFPIMSS